MRNRPRTASITSLALLAGLLIAAPSDLLAKPPPRGQRENDPLTRPKVKPRPDTQKKIDELVGDVHEPEIALHIVPRKSRLVRFKRPVLRISNSHPSVVKVVVYSRTEMEFIGLKPGFTNLTLWFAPKENERHPPVMSFRAGSRLRK